MLNYTPSSTISKKTQRFLFVCLPVSFLIIHAGFQGGNKLLCSIYWAFSLCIWVLFSRLRIRTVSWFGASLAEAAIPQQAGDATHRGHGKTHHANVTCPAVTQQRPGALHYNGSALPFWVCTTNANVPCCYHSCSEAFTAF